MGKSITNTAAAETAADLYETLSYGSRPPKYTLPFDLWK